MQFSFATGDAAKSRCEVLVLGIFDNELSDKKKQPKALASIDKKLKGLLVKAAMQEGFKGKAEQLFSFHSHGKIAAARVFLLGLGSRARYQPEVLRMAAGRAIKAANRLRAKSITVALPVARDAEQTVRAVVEGLTLGAYRYDRWRTTNREEQAAPRVEKVALLLPDGQKKEAALVAAVELAQRIATATNWARDLVNEPAGTMTPTILANEAKKMATETGLALKVGDRKEIDKLKMGMFVGVTQGSLEEPRLIQLTYTPKDAEAAARRPVVLVGKAITFDSGGLSLKTAEGMVDMKTDMAGSAAVLGAMRVIAHLAPPFPVHAMMGACENMPSGNAYRPGDVLVSRLGKTVEITNTDAEGRLVLGDMLAYANELKPALLIDIATLTGACMIALGHYLVGAFGDDDQAVWAVLEAARQAGEEFWRLPIPDAQKDALRSDIADMKNSGERYGGAINGAVFLKEFVGDTPWVHLDIAGPSQSPKERGYYAKGATGVGVRTFVELIRRRAAEMEAAAAPVPTA
ncbi:MAG: leucyl aminopeptidase [Myxococcaceae bacterium]|nr:leucyl aminopeptidase [Myxococcaceae bacterium]